MRVIWGPHLCRSGRPPEQLHGTPTTPALPSLHTRTELRLPDYRKRFSRASLCTLENQLIRISVVADKGADIYEFLHKPTDTEFLLRTPLGLRRQPRTLPTINLREGSFSDFYEGGWQELLPVAGDFPSESKGAQFGQHGEVALLPWSYRINEDNPERISVTFSVNTTRTPLHLNRTMIVEDGEPALRI